MMIIIYGYACIIISFWLLNYKKLLKLIDFVYNNFRLRSAKGKLNLNIKFEQIWLNAVYLLYSQA